MSQSNWKIIHASVIGTSHIERGTECQDRHDYKIINTDAGEVLAVVLADGAGSSDCSQFGAEIACSLFIEEIEKQISENGNLKNLNKEFGLIWLDYFQQKIGEYAEEQEKQIRDFACTLLAAVVWENGAAFYQVGDGGIICSLTGETESYYFGVTPAKKIYANATNFITDENAGKSLLFESTPETIEDLVMFTDGIEPIAVNIQNQIPYEPFLIPMIAPLRKAHFIDTRLNGKLESFLNSQRINEKTDDDKTLFLASRYKSLASEPEFLQPIPVEEKIQNDSLIADSNNGEKTLEKEEQTNEIAKTDKVYIPNEKQGRIIDDELQTGVQS